MAKEMRDMTERELRDLMNYVGAAVDIALPQDALFVVLAFDPDGVAQYVSNADRADIIQALRDAADLLDGNEDIKR